MIPAIITGAIVLLIVLYVAVTYNGLVRKNIIVEEAFSTMDVYLKRRFDLIPNLVETVKGYVWHEQDTLSRIVELRDGSYGGMSQEQKVKKGVALSNEISRIFALAEQYPELKANSNFLDLSGQLQQIENDIASARKFYNGAVKQYNYAVQSVPSNLVAGMFHFEKKQMYDVDEKERENVSVKF